MRTDDLLSEAFLAATADVEPDPAMWDRITEGVAARAAARRRRSTVAGVCTAAAVAALVVGAVAVTREEPARVTTRVPPAAEAPPTSASELPPPTAPPVTVAPTELPPDQPDDTTPPPTEPLPTEADVGLEPCRTYPGGVMPATLVAARDDGAIVEIDTATGDVVREVAAVDPDEHDGPVDTVTVTEDRRSVYWSVDGLLDDTRFLKIDDAPAAEVGEGLAPHVTPDGLGVVWVERGAVRASRWGAEQTWALPETVFANPAWSCTTGRIAWEASGDGGILAVGFTDQAELPDETVERARVLTPPDGRWWTLPAFRGDGMLVVADGTTGYVLDPRTGEVTESFDYGVRPVDQQFDVTGTWLLLVTDAGELRWTGGGRSGSFGTGFTAADW